METHMNRNSKTLILVSVLLVLAVLAAFLSSYGFYHQGAIVSSTGEGTVVVGGASTGDIELFLFSRTVVSTVNIALLLVLVITYFNIFLKTKSEFSIGLLIFALVFLTKEITASPILGGPFGFMLFGQLWIVLLPDVLELVALSIIVYLSVK